MEVSGKVKLLRVKDSNGEIIEAIALDDLFDFITELNIKIPDVYQKWEVLMGVIGR